VKKNKKVQQANREETRHEERKWRPVFRLKLKTQANTPTDGMCPKSQRTLHKKGREGGNPATLGKDRT
jgi:hypothetical protein